MSAAAGARTEGVGGSALTVLKHEVRVLKAQLVEAKAERDAAASTATVASRQAALAEQDAIALRERLGLAAAAGGAVSVQSRERSDSPSLDAEVRSAPISWSESTLDRVSEEGGSAGKPGREDREGEATARMRGSSLHTPAEALAEMWSRDVESDVSMHRLRMELDTANATNHQLRAAVSQMNRALHL